MGTARPPAHDHRGALRVRTRALRVPVRLAARPRSRRSPTSMCWRSSTPLGVFRSTAADGIVWVNHRFLEIVGLSQDQVARRRLVARRAPAGPSPHRRCAGVASTPRPLTSCWRSASFAPDGSVRHVRARVLPCAERPDEPVMFVGAIEDVTSRVEELHSATAGPGQTRSARSWWPRPSASSTPTSPVGSSYVNDPWLEICGIRAEDILGTDDLRVAHPDDRDAIFESMSAAALAGEEWFGEMRVLRPDGGPPHAHQPRCDPRLRGPDHRVRGHARRRHRRGHRPQAGRARAAGAGRGGSARSRDLARARDRVRRRCRRTGRRGARAAGPVRRRGLGRPGGPHERAEGGQHPPARLVRTRIGEPSPGTRRGLGDRRRGVDRLGHALVAPGRARGRRREERSSRSPSSGTH